MAAELLPCPFCGSAPRFLEHDPGIYTESVICDKCCNEDGHDVATRGYGQSAAAWNRRTPPAGAGEAVVFVRGDFAGISTDEGFAADNLAVALCSYFSDSLIRPVNDEETENGWGAWVEAQTDKVLDAIAAKANSRNATPSPAAAQPERAGGGDVSRDSALLSARFRAACYRLVGIVEGVEGMGRRWAANGERLKDTPEWVAFYNAAADMRNGRSFAIPHFADRHEFIHHKADCYTLNGGSGGDEDCNCGAVAFGLPRHARRRAPAGRRRGGGEVKTVTAKATMSERARRILRLYGGRFLLMISRRRTP
jgi:hypothetical protein